MGRAKLEMKYIAKEKTRNTTYEKRKNGMIKKASEFKTLCDVDTAMIIFPPNSAKPEIWPDDPNMIKKSIAFYKSKEENGKKMYGLKDYFEDRKKKIEDELMKTRKRNLEAKYATWFDELDGLSEGQLRHFAMGLEQKENCVREFLELKKRIKFETSNYFQYGGGGASSSSHVGVVDHHHHNNINNHNHVMNMMNHGFWFDHGAPGTTSFVPVKSEVGGGYGYGYGYGGYPMFESGGVVYGNNGMNPWMFQPPAVVQGGVMMPEQLGMQEFEPQVNVGGVGEFVMDDYRGRFMG